jgi:hypothetical protein
MKFKDYFINGLAWVVGFGVLVSVPAYFGIDTIKTQIQGHPERVRGIEYALQAAGLFALSGLAVLYVAYLVWQRIQGLAGQRTKKTTSPASTSKTPAQRSAQPES